MNISTGGPHILFFERDQQLATLLNSELQLAGYTCHTARTAVEVFDAIARFSIRLVLVNLAQAAAARREFWVALETQSRDRKVQVVTFLCTNLAGYGPRDLEDRPQNTMADIEIEGMSGLMSLVEAVKTRVPASALETVNTLPRMPRISGGDATPPPQMGRSVQQQPVPSMPPQNMQGGDTAYRPTAATDPNQFGLSGRNAAPPPTVTNASQASTNNANQYNGQMPLNTTMGTDQQTYSEKIRAVLYPNQQQQQPQPQNMGRGTARGAGTHPLTEPREIPNPANNAASLNTRPAPDGPLNAPNAGQPASALHRLAGLSDGESGLAQLSRMAQGMRLPAREEINPTLPTDQPAPQNWAQALQAQLQAEEQQQNTREQYQSPLADSSIRSKPPFSNPFTGPATTTGPNSIYQQGQNIPGLSTSEMAYRQPQNPAPQAPVEPVYRQVQNTPPAQSNPELSYRTSPGMPALNANEPIYRQAQNIPPTQSNPELSYRQTQGIPTQNSPDTSYRQPQSMPNTSEPVYRQAQNIPPTQSNPELSYRQTQGIPTQSNPDLSYRPTQGIPVQSGNTGPMGQIKGTIVTNRRETRQPQSQNVAAEIPGVGTSSSPEQKHSIGPITVPNASTSSYLATSGEQQKNQEVTHTSTDPQAEDDLLTKRAEAIAQTIYAATTQQYVQGTENIASQPLRASPIHDVTIERTGSGPAIPDGPKRPDVLSRTNYGQQQATQGKKNLSAVTPLASIATPMPPVQNSAKNPTAAVPLPSPQDPPGPVEDEPETDQLSESNDIRKLQEEINSSAIKQGVRNTQPSEEAKSESEDEPLARNSVLLDIVQSLPPMPDLPPQQSMQAQVLNGRATRSLNKVLLEGHLVPQDRLEVAQNIQRMLRGVDLNYQLGEILLMFKLLTPDQLLAASLVSYGLINTTQISSLGHIRQELHSIGLEYDLENLLVLFRILTPEQLREVRSSLLS